MRRGEERGDASAGPRGTALALGRAGIHDHLIISCLRPKWQVLKIEHTGTGTRLDVEKWDSLAGSSRREREMEMQHGRKI